MKTLISLLSILLLLDAQSFAQSASPAGLDNLKTVIPPSPDASSLGKFAAFPVSLYTGVPNVDIPIYTLKARTTAVPVSLSYHAAGFRVGENPSWVGLGWALQAGGVITRSLRGLPDDDPYTGYLVLRQSYTSPGDLGSRTTPESIDSNNKVNASTGLSDGEPDVYSLNALGRSYRIFFSGTGTILTEPYSALKITCNWSDSTWKVITEDGTILNFGGGPSQGHYLDLTTNTKISPNPAYDITTFISSWYLKSIVTTGGEVINFTYNATTITENTFFAQSDNMYNTFTGAGANGQASCGCAGGGGQGTLGVPNLKTNYGTQQVVSLTPATIESDLTRVEFVPHTTERQDLQGGYALDSIRIYSKLQNQYIKKFALSHSYATASSSTIYNTSNSYYGYRLHLTGIEEIPSDNTKHDFWSFQYNPLNLPGRMSFAQDYWGFFNGQTSNSSLLPEIFPTNAYYSSFSPPVYSVGNRNPDSASMQAEMLTMITYPTGGTATFNYQPNEYAALTEAYQSYNANGNIQLDTGHLSPFTITYTQVIRVNYPQMITLHGVGSFSNSYAADFGNGVTLGLVRILENNPPSGYGPITGSLSFTGNGSTQNLSVSLRDTGSYTFTVTIPGAATDQFVTDSDYARLTGSFTYSDSIGLELQNIMVGGVRIGSQVIYDGMDSNRNQYISYSYSNPLVIAPLDVQNNFITTYQEQLKQDEGGVCEYMLSSCFQEYLVRHSASQESFGAVQGGTIGYGTVQTTYGRHGENGYTISTFSSQSDENLSNAAIYPYPGATVTDWRRGQLLQQNDFTAGGQMVRSKVENYTYVVPTYIVGFKTGTNTLYNDGVSYGLTNVHWIDESDKTEQVQYVSSVETVYDQVTSAALTTTTTFYYDNSNDLLPTRTISIDSKQDTVLQFSRTALEESDINSSIPLTGAAIAAIDTMINRNMVGIPLETERYVGGVLANKTLANYALQGSGFVMPGNVMIQNASNPIETRINFLKYDTYGNLIQQARSNDENHNYIYDYTANYPIAEVVNGDSTSVAYTSFESNGTGGWSLGSGMVDTTKGITGTKSFIPSAAITKSGLTSTNTYVVSYWTTASAALTISGTVTGYPIKGKSISISGNLWTYYEHKVTGITSVSVPSGSSNIDELRLYPATAMMTTYTYLPLFGISSKCDVDNRITYYEYDGLQRLRDIRDQDGNVVKTIEYHYAGQ